MSAVMAPFDALGSVSRQNGSSSTLDATVGLLRPITLNFDFGSSCARTPHETADPSTIAVSQPDDMELPPFHRTPKGGSSQPPEADSSSHRAAIRCKWRDLVTAGPACCRM